MSLEFGGIFVVQSMGKKSYMIAKVKRIIETRKSDYQKIEIVELEEFGRALILDGLIQSTESDENYYHEILVHPAMTLHKKPEKILIIGGGEGATLREVLKHNTVREAIMVDIDPLVIELCKKYLECMHQGSFYNPKAKVVISDGLKYVNEVEDKFDVIILDLTDPYASKIARKLYSKKFYEKMYSKLNDDGVLVTQAGNSFFYEKEYDDALNALKQIFPIVIEYNIWIPSFAYACNFILASKHYDPNKLSINEIDRRLKERNVKTIFFNGKTWNAILNLPIYRNLRK